MCPPAVGHPVHAHARGAAGGPRVPAQLHGEVEGGGDPAAKPGDV